MWRLVFCLLNLIALVRGEWYTHQTGFCSFLGPWLTDMSTQGARLYNCNDGKEYVRTSALTYATCGTTSCFKDEEADQCLSGECSFVNGQCFCVPISDPSLPEPEGCNACASADCPCANALGYGVLGYDGSGSTSCECDVYEAMGDDCEGGAGTGSLDSGSILIAPGACQYDATAELYRTVACEDEDTVIVTFYSDECSTVMNQISVDSDTCYYPSGVLQSVMPTSSPTAEPTETAAPTPEPTMTNAPTFAPIVYNYEDCSLAEIRDSIEPTIRASGDDVWVEACLFLIDSESEHIQDVCACFGKMSKRMALDNLNCMVLAPSYTGLQVWDICQEESQLAARRLEKDLETMNFVWAKNHRRRLQASIASDVFSLTWPSTMCSGETAQDANPVIMDFAANEVVSLPTPDPTDAPTPEPTRDPTAEPTPQPTPEPTKAPSPLPTPQPTEEEALVTFPQPNDSEFWQACGSIGTVARGKVLSTTFNKEAHECAIACNEHPDCDYFNYDASRNKCSLRKQWWWMRHLNKPVFEHGVRGNFGNNLLAGFKTCPYGEYANIWDHVDELRRLEGVDSHLEPPLDN